MSLTTGTRLGPYEIVAAIGAGGMGEVYRARDARLQRDVAIKVLPETFATDEARLSRFEQEALATAALNHPNILVVFDIGREGRVAYGCRCARRSTTPRRSRRAWLPHTPRASSIET